MKTDSATPALRLEDFAGHTPGDWHVKDGYLITIPEYGEIANLRGQLSPYRETVTDANARLIAAAPQLLAELRESRAREAEMAKHLEVLAAAGSQCASDWVSKKEAARALLAKKGGAA